MLGYRQVDADLIDPRRAGPPFWFRQMEAPAHSATGSTSTSTSRRTGPRRVAAGLVAGGHLVSDANAPEWWTLADAEDNEVDIAPWPDQD